MYSESELVRRVKIANDEAVKKMLLMFIAAAADMFDLDDDGIIEFLGLIQRCQQYEDMGLLPLEKYSEILAKHGINLRLSRW